MKKYKYRHKYSGDRLNIIWVDGTIAKCELEKETIIFKCPEVTNNIAVCKFENLILIENE